MKEIKDPAKLKVVELRAELSARGLDTKGNKPILVSRLREALEAEGDEVPADTSILDTSEELESSQVTVASPECILPEDASSDSAAINTNESPETILPDDDPLGSSQSSVIVRPDSESQSSPKKEEMDVPATVEESDVKTDINDPELLQSETNGEKEHKPQEQYNTDDDVVEVKSEDEKGTIENRNDDIMEVEEVKDTKEDLPEPRAKKSRWGSVTEENKESEETPDDSSDDAKTNKNDNKEVRNENRESKENRDREKRRRSPSPRRRSRSPRKPDDEPELDENSVLLSWNDSDLQLEIAKENFYSACINQELPLTGLWAGARATYGVKGKKVWYEVKLVSNCKQNETLKEEKNPHLLRIGWSVIQTPLQLGESKNSYGFDATGYKATDNIFERYGKRFHEGDVVGSYVDLESDPVAISFTVNGVNQGIAFHISKEELNDNALYPHIVTKNISYEVNFGQNENPWFEPNDKQDDTEDDDEIEDEKVLSITSEKTDEEKQENGAEEKMDTSDNQDKSENISEEKNENENENEEKNEEVQEDSNEQKQQINKEKEKKCILGWASLNDGYVLIGLLPKDERMQGLERLAKREDCEVIMMCGLPCSGKTHWVRNWIMEHPEKHYTILGTSQLLDMMTVNGKPRKDNHSGRWDAVLDKCNRTINKLLELACLRRRNYILDQTNIFPSAQRRKMRSFEGFQRRAVVVIPSEEEYAKRQAKRAQTDGKDVPDSAVLEMKANMSLPEKGDPFIEIIFPELGESEARVLVERYNEEGRKAGYGPQYSSKRPRVEWNERRSGSSWSRHGGGSKPKRNENRSSGGNRWSHNQRSGGGGGGGGSGGGGSGGGGGGHGSDRRHGGGNWSSGSSGRWSGLGGRNGPPIPRGGPMGGPPGGVWRNMGGGRQGGGGGYNRNQGGGGGSGFNRRGGPPSGGGNRNQQRQGNWTGSQNSWGSGWGNQSGGGGSGHWGQGGNPSGSGGGQGSNWSAYGNSANQWKGYQNQQGAGAITGSNSGTQGSQGGNQSGSAAAQQWVGYPGYGWGNYYGQYAQGWGAQGQGATGTGANQMYNQYSQQWAQYAQQASYGGYTTTASQQSGGKKDDKKT